MNLYAKGFALKLPQPPACPLASWLQSNEKFPFYYDTASGRGEAIYLKGVNCDEKMDGPLFNINSSYFFPSRVCRNVERYLDSMSEMRLFL